MSEEMPGTHTKVTVVVPPASGINADTEGGNLVTNAITIDYCFFIASPMRRDSSMLEETPGTCTNVVGTPASGRDADTEGGNLVTNVITTDYCFFIASAMRRDSSMFEETPGTCTNVVGTPASGRDVDTEGENLVSNKVNNNHH